MESQTITPQGTDQDPTTPDPSMPVHSDNSVPPQSSSNKSKKILIILCIMIAALAAAIAAWLLFFRSDITDKTSTSVTTNNTQDSEQTSADVAPDYIENKNSEYGFSFAYPESWGGVVFTRADAELGYNGGGSIEFGNNTKNTGRFELGPLKPKSYQGEPDNPVFRSATDTAKSLSERSETALDGGKYRYELIADNGDSHVFAYCYYGIGVDIQAKLGDNMMELSLNFGGYPSGSSMSHDCAKSDTRKLSEIISQEDLTIAKTIAESMRQN